MGARDLDEMAAEADEQFRADQNRCPACGGTGKRESPEHPRPIIRCRKCYDTGAVNGAPCPECGGTGNKTSGEAGPAPVGGGLDEARQGGEGEAVGRLAPSPELPADLIDRAVEALESVRRGMHVNTTGGRQRQDAEAVVEAVGPLLVAHGEAQEKARWEARIEELAGNYTSLSACYKDLGLSSATAETYALAAQDLRSLLEEGGDSVPTDTVMVNRADLQEAAWNAGHAKGCPYMAWDRNECNCWAGRLRSVAGRPDSLLEGENE